MHKVLNGYLPPDFQHLFLDHAKSGRWENVKQMVLKFPTIVNVQPKGRWSALHQAVFFSVWFRSIEEQKELVEFLLEHGADPLAVIKIKDEPEEPSLRALAGKMVTALDLAKDTPDIETCLDKSVILSAKETSLSPDAFVAHKSETEKQLPNSFYPLGEKIGNGFVVSSAIDKGGDIVPLVLINNTLHEGPPPVPEQHQLGAAGLFSQVEVTPPERRDPPQVPILGLETPLDEVPNLVVNYIVSDCGREILNSLDKSTLSEKCRAQGGKTIVRQMIILPSQLNGAEHPLIEDNGIPLYELENSKDTIMKKLTPESGPPPHHWFITYCGDGTGGPIAQLRASLEVAQEVVRISEANTEKRRETDWDVHNMPINYVREVINALPEGTRETIYLQNGYLQCHEASGPTAVNFIQNMDKMTCLMSVGNPSSGVSPFELPKGREEGAKKIDMVYASAIPIKGKYVVGKEGNDTISLIGLNVIFNQYLIALSQAFELAKDLEEGQVYDVLAMPLGTGVFENPALYALIGLREAMRVIYTKFPESMKKLDIKLLFWDGKKASRTTDEEDFVTEINEAGFNPGGFLKRL